MTRDLHSEIDNVKPPKLTPCPLLNPLLPLLQIQLLLAILRHLLTPVKLIPVDAEDEEGVKMSLLLLMLLPLLIRPRPLLMLQLLLLRILRRQIPIPVAAAPVITGRALVWQPVLFKLDLSRPVKVVILLLVKLHRRRILAYRMSSDK